MSVLPGALQRAAAAKRRFLVASALVGAGGLLALATASAIARSSEFDPLFISGVVQLSAVLITVVVFVLGRNLVKLYLDHSRGVPGSRYRTKVISLVAGLTLLPSLLLFFMASGILQQSVEQLFQEEVESVIEGGADLVRVYLEEDERRAQEWMAGLVKKIDDDALLRRRLRGELEQFLGEARASFGLAGVRVYDRSGQVIAESYDRDRADGLRHHELPAATLAMLMDGRREQLRSAPDKTGQLIAFYGRRIGVPERASGAIVVATRLSLNTSATLKSLDESRLAYQRVKDSRYRVKQGFVLVLAFFTLLLLFAAIWVGSALSKTMTVPIQSLAEATRAVSEGRFDVRVEGDAPDELGVLVRSFNRMMEELRLGKVRVERSTGDLQRTNSELEGRRKFIETILESIPTGVIALDEDGLVTNINQTAIAMFAFQDIDRLGQRHYRELFGGKEFLELHFLIEKVMGIRDINFRRDHLHVQVDRRPLDLSVSFTALRDAQERYIGLILVLEDLSNLIKAQKVAAWREVARRIAHEIKNPLTPIQLSAQRIRKKWRQGDPDLGQVIEDCTETITHEVDGLKTLVNEFSRFARMPPVSPVPTQLDKLIHNALVLYDGVHPGLRLDRHIAPDIPTLNLDPEQLKRALINLIDNAIHCQGGVGRVIVRATRDGSSQCVRLEVTDEGPGIPPADRDKLFVPYFSTKRGGTGLGLAIVHRIVSDHGGRIRVEEHQPRGTRFVIELPA